MCCSISLRVLKARAVHLGELSRLMLSMKAEIFKPVAPLVPVSSAISKCSAPGCCLAVSC